MLFLLSHFPSQQHLLSPLLERDCLPQLLDSLLLYHDIAEIFAANITVFFTYIGNRVTNYYHYYYSHTKPYNDDQLRMSTLMLVILYYTHLLLIRIAPSQLLTRTSTVCLAIDLTLRKLFISSHSIHSTIMAVPAA